MIVCKLGDILAERSMSRRELARRSRLNINTVCKLAKDDHRMIDRLTLDRVCTPRRAICFSAPPIGKLSARGNL